MLFLTKLPRLLASGGISTFSRCLSTNLHKANTNLHKLTPTLIPSQVVPSLLIGSDRLNHFAQTLNSNVWIYEIGTSIELPNIIKPIEINDIIPKLWIEDPLTINKQVEDPETLKNLAIECARLLVIRRKKMKKHKLKKLRKRMKYTWAKVRQRRELKKEKDFQAGLIAQCQKAEAFDAAEFVKEQLRLVNMQPPKSFMETEKYKEMRRIKKLRLYQYEPFKDYLK